MTILTVVGARPQFIKAAPVSKALKERGIREILLHTGQHYDTTMSQVFFDELEIPAPEINLGIGSCSHGKQTGRMLEDIEIHLLEQKPDILLVYGDTNSTLAGALAAAKLHIPVAHIEAGLRSYNRNMPEEHNRVLTDHCSTHLFCPTQTAVDNLRKEGITENVHLVGDPMLDAVLHFLPIAKEKSTILDELNLSPGEYFLTTLHRPSNVDDPNVLTSLVGCLGSLSLPVIFPIHPRTLQKIEALTIPQSNKLKIIPPVGYLDMLQLLDNAQALMTDSGGLQKEAIFLKTPCITLREETEWMETLLDNANQLTGSNPDKIQAALANLPNRSTFPINVSFGDGSSARQTTRILAALPVK
jgi:UDP-GlcNAc3NAcA epimerase